MMQQRFNRKYLFTFCVSLSVVTHAISVIAITAHSAYASVAHIAVHQKIFEKQLRPLKNFITKPTSSLHKNFLPPMKETMTAQLFTPPSADLLLNTKLVIRSQPISHASQKMLPPITPKSHPHINPHESNNLSKNILLHLHEKYKSKESWDKKNHSIAVFENISPQMTQIFLERPSHNDAHLTSAMPPLRITSPAQHASLPHFTINPALFISSPLTQFKTTSYSDAFETEVIVFPMNEAQEYIFAITLIPHQDIALPSMTQHYHFLIDCSNSMEAEKLTAVKKATIKAIEELNDMDYFNIIAFDSTAKKLFPHPKPRTQSTISAASEFLQTLTLGSFFSVSNLCKPLLLATPWNEEKGVVHTAILYTDGETLIHPAVQQELGLQWTMQNQGKLSLFSIGLGEENRSAILDTLCSFNRGKMIPCSTKAGIKRKVLKLMKTIQDPIIKPIAIKTFSKLSKEPILIEKTKSEFPLFYRQEPYVILGKTKTLSSFLLFIQGEGSKEWIHIKKEISLLDAKKGTLAHPFLTDDIRKHFGIYR